MGKTSKKFWDERSKKLQKKRKKYIKKSYYAKSKEKAKLKKQEPDYDYLLPVPDCFSFVNNLEKTSMFFGDIISKFRQAQPKSSFLIESSSVEEVTTDAIMYMIALMKNHKDSRKKLYSFYGTYPINANAKKIYMESGLLKFVKSRSRRLPENNSKMAIMCGNNSNALLAKQICEFVSNKLNVSNIYVKELYEVVIEMMSNVYYHAYNDVEDSMIPEWYMYAEHDNEQVKFLFLDTGFGIGKTVKKHSLYEKVVSKIGIGSESKLILSALDGEFRTQTGKLNHGRGLPSIKEFACGNKIDNFHIISGKGHCWLANDYNEFCGEELKNNILGTIYSFTIKKTEV